MKDSKLRTDCMYVFVNYLPDPEAEFIVMGYDVLVPEDFSNTVREFARKAFANSRGHSVLSAIKNTSAVVDGVPVYIALGHGAN